MVVPAGLARIGRSVLEPFPLFMGTALLFTEMGLGAPGAEQGYQRVAPAVYYWPSGVTVTEGASLSTVPEPPLNTPINQRTRTSSSAATTMPPDNAERARPAHTGRPANGCGRGVTITSRSMATSAPWFPQVNPTRACKKCIVSGGSSASRTCKSSTNSLRPRATHKKSGITDPAPRHWSSRPASVPLGISVRPISG